MRTSISVWVIPAPLVLDGDWNFALENAIQTKLDLVEGIRRWQVVPMTEKGSTMGVMLFVETHDT